MSAAMLSKVKASVAPVWPLPTFVAVNPYLGVTGMRFADADIELAPCTGASMTMDRSYYRDAWRRGRLTERDLQLANERAMARGVQVPPVTQLLDALREDPSPFAEPSSPTAATGAHTRSLTTWPLLSDVAGMLDGRHWDTLIVERIGDWAAAYYDEGQARWRSPFRDLPPYAAWLSEATIDRTPEVMGLSGFRSRLKALPKPDGSPPAAPLQALIDTLRVHLDAPELAIERYLTRALYTICGWAARARHHDWNRGLRGQSTDTVSELLAIRVAWELALLECHDRTELVGAWRRAWARTESEVAENSSTVAVDQCLHDAFELGWERTLLGKMESRTPQRARPEASGSASPPAAQVVFCIDVRSEGMRRGLEEVNERIETLGFAGFFGFAVDHTPLSHMEAGARCPVLLAPGARTAEHAANGDSAATLALEERRLQWASRTRAWKAFKQSAVSCFGFVGPVGLAYAYKLLSDLTGRTRTEPAPEEAGVGTDARNALAPTLLGESGKADVSAEAKANMAEGALRGMSLVDGFARVVALVGHGSTTVNNPHAAGLDCGACGGHKGDVNARIGAQVLNERDVRAILRQRGIDIPDATLFVAALHDTTTDAVTVLDEAAIPSSHRQDVEALKAAFQRASRSARRARAPMLGVASDGNLDADVLRRSRDWSEPRPEWGLAGCATFIAAPRAHTRGVDFDGRAFLHSYDWRLDGDRRILELILTAPLVVASWINLQYFGSTVAPGRFGSGNKTLHNVTGATVGVVEGNGGDLRTGLAWQSVHDGARFVHEPVRLHAIVAAPVDAIEATLDAHPEVRELLDNDWVRLYRMNDQGSVVARYRSRGEWAQTH